MKRLIITSLALVLALGLHAQDAKSLIAENVTEAKEGEEAPAPSKYFTLDEYQAKIKDAQTDKDGNLVVLYTQDPDANYTHIERAKQLGYDVLVMDGELDVHVMSQAEQKNDKLRFARVDSDLIENLIRKEEQKKVELSAEQQEGMRKAFDAQLPKGDKLNYYVAFEAAPADALPVFLMQNEFMRRMREMSAHQQGMSFYGNMPEQYNVVINTNHPLIADLVAQMTSETVLEQPEVKEGDRENEVNKEEPNPAEEKTVYTLAGHDDRIAELIDLAFLASGHLKGEALAKFVNRSLGLLSK